MGRESNPAKSPVQDLFFDLVEEMNLHMMNPGPADSGTQGQSDLLPTKTPLSLPSSP